MKKLIIILFLAFLQSCSSDGYVKNRDFRLSDNSKTRYGTAIIITGNNTEFISTGAIASRFDHGFTEMNWCKDEEQKNCKEIFYSSPYTKKKFYGQRNYYSIESGTYYLDEIKEMPNYTDNLLLLPFKFLVDAGTYGAFVKPNFNTSPSGWNKKLNAPNFASFETNPGEIVYIGDLFFTFTKQKYWVKGKINLEVKDNYDQAVIYFRTQYPEYKDKPVIKRLAKPGVLLDDYDAGIFW